MAKADLIGKKVGVLDKGFVRLVDVMGDDSAIVQAARVSYGAGTKTVREDAALIRYLMRNNHGTPFEMASMKFHLRMPMDVNRQFVRHRTFSFNEYSTRYSEAIDDKQRTEPHEWRTQSGTNKQGSADYMPYLVGTGLSIDEADLHAHAYQVYHARLEAGVAREQARKDLPLSTYTELYAKVDLRNLLHFLGLRMDSHAQWEIRQYANAIGQEFVAPLFPATWAAFEDYRLNGMSLSVYEQQAIHALYRGQTEHIDSNYIDGLFPTKREAEEFWAKWEKITFHGS